MTLSPLALKVKQIIDGTYIAHKRGRRFRIKEYEIVEILNAVTQLENGGSVKQEAPEAPKVLKKGDPGYEEWLASLPASKNHPLKKEETK